MLASEFFKLAKSKNWSSFVSFLNSVNTPNDCKILLSAIIEAEHPDSSFKKLYGLNQWNEKLSSVSKRGGVVNLADFFRAYEMSSNGSNLHIVGLNDNFVAAKIKDYVLKHKTKLVGIFKNQTFQDIEIDALKHAFGSLRGQIIDELRTKIEKLLGLKPDTCAIFPEVSKDEDNQFFIGLYSSSEKDDFENHCDELEPAELEDYATLLKKMGLPVEGVQSSLMYAEDLINVHASHAQLLEQLEEIEKKYMLENQKFKLFASSFSAESDSREKLCDEVIKNGPSQKT